MAVLLLAAWSNVSVQSYQFISPLPGSENNSAESTIAIRDGRPIDAGSLTEGSIVVTGSLSGRVTGTLVLSSDGKTLIFKPDRVFRSGETVQVQIRPGLRTGSGQALEAGRFEFGVAPFSRTPSPYDLMPELRPDAGAAERKTTKTATDSLPPQFPPVTVEMLDSTALGDGYIFLAVASDVEDVGYYLMMLNNDGTPFFARQLDHDYAYDFKMQPDGRLSYAHFFEHHSYTGGGNVVHKILDPSFTLVDSVQMGNGYVAEAHDFQILPNGHYLVFGYYLTPVDMSAIVDGGRPDALVSGGIVQELDADQNVIFQWRSWDHYSFEDWEFSRRQRTRAIVSTFHLNTINLDDDGRILLSTPTWTKKIDRQTGEVLWTLGGHLNEFSFTNVDSADGLGMVGGHTFHRLPNGNMLLYDNGNRSGTRTSRVHELALDEQGRTVEVVWTYEPDSLIAGWHRGSAQRLANGNTVIGWGGSSGLPSPAMTEVNAAGEKLYEISFDPPAIESYRAFRFPFSGGAPAASVVVTEVAPGNTYEFAAGDTVDTGISVDVVAIGGTGYNELTVHQYHYAPVDPEFVDAAPVVQPARMVLDQFGLTSIELDVQFDVSAWSIDDPASTIIYHREFEGNGLFVALPTSYNPAKQIVEARSKRIGEFILARPNPAAAAYTPAPLFPADSSSVNQTLPLTVEWTPVGYARSYALQIALDEAFTNLLVDEDFLVDARYTLDELNEGENYYWRTRATNEAGTSDWTATQVFSTTAPYITLIEPIGGEELIRGLDYYIRWSDNVPEDVVIELHVQDAVVDTIATTASDGAYEWEVRTDLATGPDYSIKIFSSSDPSVVDSHDEAFSIVLETSVEDQSELPATYRLEQNYPNPFNPTTTIAFETPQSGHVNLSIFDVSGRRVATLADEVFAPGRHMVSIDATPLPGGVYFYRLEAPGFEQTAKMVLLK